MIEIYGLYVHWFDVLILIAFGALAFWVARIEEDGYGKTIPEERTVVRDRHLFYCDGCGVFLGESEEYEDGYYANIGDYEWKYYDKVCGWLHKRGNYCPECQAKVSHQIMSALGNIGFRQDR